MKADIKLRYKNILLRDFRTVKDGEIINFNIGTAAHGPATLAVLKKYLPQEVKITVWADAPLSVDLKEMMQRRFPDILIVWGDLTNNPSEELLKAVDSADLFLISSGSTIADSVHRSMEHFKKRTGKPAAAYAIGCTSGILPWINSLDFAWLRDPTAAEIASSSACKLTGWAPDAVFDFDAVDRDGVERFMKANSLAANKFICCIPGQRNTPRWQYFGTPVNPDKAAENARFEEHDNAPLREIIKIAIQDFGLKVLICPEQRTEIALIRPLIYDRLSPELREHCIPMDTMWTPDIALGVYQASRGVFGVEMHSQVMAVGSGVPGVLLRHPVFGSKSEMWKTIGIPEWLINTEDPDYATKSAATARDILAHSEKNKTKLLRARQIIDRANQNAVQRSFFISHTMKDDSEN